MQDEKDEFDEIKQALSEQKEMNAALSDSIEEQKKIFEKFEEDEVKVLSSIKSHSEKFRLGFVSVILDCHGQILIILWPWNIINDAKGFRQISEIRL